MAWNKELTKEDLIKAGLDPADLAEMKANGVKKADLDSMKTEFTTSLTSITESLKALEAKIGQPVVKQDNSDNKDNADKPDEQTEFLTDPVGFTNKKMSQAVGYAALTSTKMRMDLALDRAKATLRGFRNEALKTEIMEEWNKYKPEQFAMSKDFDPDLLITKVHNMVMGNHIDDINRDTDKKEGKFNMVASSTGGGGGRSNIEEGNKKPEDQLTPIEIKQAARYGMKPEEWLAQKIEMEKEEEKVMAQG